MRWPDLIYRHELDQVIEPALTDEQGFDYYLEEHSKDDLGLSRLSVYFRPHTDPVSEPELGQKQEVQS
jgi:hypothetical protein